MKFLSAIARFMASFGILAYTSWVFLCLWGWFIVPTFGLPVVTFTQSLGMVVIMGFVKLTPSLDLKTIMIFKKVCDDSDTESMEWANLAIAIFADTYILGVGWIVSLLL